jgi:hypothetical protein
VVQQSRTFKYQPCPHCGKSSYRGRVFTRTLYDVGDLISGRPRDIVLTYSQHYCGKCHKYFNADASDLAPLPQLSNRPSRPSPQGTPEALPYPILRRLSSTNQSHAAPLYALLRAAPAGRSGALGARQCRERGVAGGEGVRPGWRRRLYSSYPSWR